MIYKYYPDNEYTYDALTNAYFYFSKTAKLNDPYDTSFTLISSEVFNSKLVRLGMNSDASNLMNQYGTCSFSKCKNNMHLWSLYASNFAGLVIGFEEKPLNDMPIHFNGLTPLVEIDYVDELIDFDNEDYPFDLKYQNGNIRTHTVGEALHDVRFREYLFLHLCSMKYKKVWENEEELRLIAANDFLINRVNLESKGVVYGNNGYKIPMPDNSAKEIIIGHNFTKQDKLKQICKSLKIHNVYRTACNHPFNIDIEEIR